MKIKSFIIQGKPLQIKKVSFGTYLLELLVFKDDNQTIDILIPKYLARDLSLSILKLERCTLLIYEYRANEISRYKFVELVS